MNMLQSFVFRRADFSPGLQEEVACLCSNCQQLTVATAKKKNKPKQQIMFRMLTSKHNLKEKPHKNLSK